MGDLQVPVQTTDPHFCVREAKCAFVAGCNISLTNLTARQYSLAAPTKNTVAVAREVFMVWCCPPVAPLSSARLLKLG